MLDPSAIHKAKTTWWGVAIVCFATCAFFAPLAVRQLHIPVQSSIFGLPAIIASAFIATWVCRLRGLPVTQKNVRLWQKRLDAPREAHAEMHFNPSVFRWMTLCSGAMGLLILFLGVVFPPKPVDVGSFLSVTALAGSLALCMVIFGWLKPTLTTRIDEKGVTTIMGWNRREFVNWSKISRCQEVRTFFVASNSTSRVWIFEDEAGQVVLQVVSTEVPAGRDEFSQVLAQFFQPTESP